MGNSSGNRRGGHMYPGRRIYIMYHGTTMEKANEIEHNGFRRSSKGILGPGVYMTRSKDSASRYPKNAGGQQLAILKLRVRVGKVKRIDHEGHPLQTTWHQQGYDTAWIPPNCGMLPPGIDKDCIYDPSRITVMKIIPNSRRR